MGLLREQLQPIRWHVLERPDLWEEANRQLAEAQAFGGGGKIAAMPTATKAQRAARNEAIREATKPIYEAADAHNEAHKTAAKVAKNLIELQSLAETAEYNVFLRDEPGDTVNATLDKMRAMHAEAKEAIKKTNASLPPRLQSGNADHQPA